MRVTAGIPNFMSINREPIFWTSTVPGYNTPDRERFINVDGKRVKEKFPQRGHVGDYDDKRTAPGERWAVVCRHDGHEVRMVLTNAAAHMDSATSWGQQQRGKARALGWFNPGQCPCALIATGELNPELVVDAKVRTDRPCPHGEYNLQKRCPHSLAEQAARRARHKAEQDDREAAFKTKDDKILEAMQSQIESQQRQTEALTAAVSAGRQRSAKDEK